MTSLRSTLLAAIPVLLLGCDAGTIDGTTGTKLTCYDSDEGVVCTETDGDDHPDEGDGDHPVCVDTGCVTECSATDYGERCVTECEGGLRCVEECSGEGDHQTCEHACSCPEGDGGGNGGGGDCTGDGCEPPPGDGGGDCTGDGCEPPPSDGGGDCTGDGCEPPPSDGGGDCTGDGCDPPPSDGI